MNAIEWFKALSNWRKFKLILGLLLVAYGLLSLGGLI